MTDSMVFWPKCHVFAEKATEVAPMGLAAERPSTWTQPPASLAQADGQPKAHSVRFPIASQCAIEKL
jgi:hypothetical protein